MEMQLSCWKFLQPKLWTGGEQSPLIPGGRNNLHFLPPALPVELLTKRLEAWIRENQNRESKFAQFVAEWNLGSVYLYSTTQPCSKYYKNTQTGSCMDRNQMT
ncbi:hypothetical protein CapIbe_000314 [Capra ibex]